MERGIGRSKGRGERGCSDGVSEEMKVVYVRSGCLDRPRVKSGRQRLGSRVEVNRPFVRKPSAVKCYRRVGRGRCRNESAATSVTRRKVRHCSHFCRTVVQEAVKADEEHERDGSEGSLSS